MDSLELLAREDEFKKLNKQLEKKSESLIKQIEHAMQKQDIFSEFSHSLTLSPTHSYTRKHCCETPKLSTPEKTQTKSKNTQQSSAKRDAPVTCVGSKCINGCQIANNSKNCASDCTNYDNNCKNCANGCANDAKNCKNCANGCTNDAKDCKNCANGCTNDAKDCKNCANGFKNDANDSRNDENCVKIIRNVCDCFAISRRERIEGDLEFLYAFVAVSVQESVLPQSFLKDRATVESVCKFLSSKVKLMQEQINKLQETLNKKASQCEGHLTKLAELEGERLAMMHTINRLKSSSVESKARCQAAQKKLEEKENLYKEERTEATKLSTEVKRLRTKNSSLEARCAKQDETIDNLKHQIEIAKKTEKELRDASRALSTSHASAIAELERRISILNTRISRQAALNDNLRRQRALLATEGAVIALEREYSEFLTDL